MFFMTYHVLGYRKKIIRKNLTLAFPNFTQSKIKSVEKDFYKHMCDLFLEMVKSIGISKKEMLKHFKINNLDILHRLEEQQKSTILTCGHYGNWEWLLSVAYHTNLKGYAIYKPVTNPYFDRLVKRIRKKHKAFLISKNRAIETIKRHAKEGVLGLYGFASDQSPRPRKKTYWRKFMGITVPVFTGSERLAKELDLAVVFARINRVKRGYYEADLELLTDAPKHTKENEITDTFFEWLEEQIHKDPTQYLWSHNRFKHVRKDS